MSEVNGGGASPQNPDSVGTVEASTDHDAGSASKDTVAYDTYRRTVSSEKKAKARAQELEEENNRLREATLAAEGKKDELISSLQKRLADKDELYNNAVGGFAYSSLTSQIKSEAASMGCVNSDDLVKLLDLDAFDVSNETFQASPEQVKLRLEEMRKTRPYLFNKQGPSIDPHVPSSGANTSAKKFDPKTASIDDLKARIKQIDNAQAKR